MKKAIPSALALLALIAAGCGSSAPKPAPAPGPSDSVFAAQGNSICASAEASLNLLRASGVTGATGLTALERITTAVITKLGELRPPANRAAAFRLFLATGHTQDGLIAQYIAAVEARDLTKAHTLAVQVAALGDKGDTEASAAGLATCAATPAANAG